MGKRKPLYLPKTNFVRQPDGSLKPYVRKSLTIMISPDGLEVRPFPEDDYPTWQERRAAVPEGWTTSVVWEFIPVPGW